MARITDPIPQEEATNIMFQALGMLLSDYQTVRKIDHLGFNFNGFTYKVGVREDGVIDLEKHNLIQSEPEKKLVTLDEFADGK